MTFEHCLTASQIPKMCHTNEGKSCSITKRIMFASVLLWMCTDVSGNQIYPFLEDIIANFELTAPTIILDDDVPELCMSIQWVLCLNTFGNDVAEVAQHLETLFLSRRQDAIIFAEKDSISALIRETSPSLFKSALPVFMPIKYASLIELRLDLNILFYKRVGAEEFMLVEIFNVKGGKPITQELGSWKEGRGLQLFHSKNRWNRRTDLNKAEVIECLLLYKNYGEPQYDNGSVIGSVGLHPDRLHTFAEVLNLKVTTILADDGVEGGNFGKKFKNGSWSGNVGMLTRKNADVSTIGLAWTLQRYIDIDYVDDLKMPLGGYTLIGKKSKLKTLDMWVYASVFGLKQWAIIVTFLLLIMFTSLLTSILVHQGNRVSLLQAATLDFRLVLSFFIQLGHHPQHGPYTRRIVYLVTGIMTYVVFSYYTTDITSQMTHRESEDNPFHSFDDVANFEDVKIISVKGSSWESALKQSVPGTAKYKVYKNRMEEHDVWYKSPKVAKDAVISDPNTYLYAYHTAALSHPGLKALKMNDMSVVSVGIGLQKDSEFRELFNYLMMKLVEVGIIKRINMKWPDTSRHEDFSIPEPVSLGFTNLLFPFNLLASGIIIASISVCLECLLQNVLKKSQAKKQDNHGWTTINGSGASTTINGSGASKGRPH